MPLWPMLQMIVFHLMGLYSQILCQKYPLQQSYLILLGAPIPTRRQLVVFKTGVIYKFFKKGVKSRLNSYFLSNTAFFRCRYLLSHAKLNNWITLADDFSIYSSFPPITFPRSKVFTSTISNPPVVGFYHRHSGETNIILNDISTQMMLSYRLTIWIYQVLMHRIPWFKL